MDPVVRTGCLTGAYAVLDPSHRRDKELEAGFVGLDALLDRRQSATKAALRAPTARVADRAGRRASDARFHRS